MFEGIVSKIANTFRRAVRAVGAATRRTPWFAPAVILSFFLVW